jgi:hypothetical protein
MGNPVLGYSAPLENGLLCSKGLQSGVLRPLRPRSTSSPVAAPPRDLRAYDHRLRSPDLLDLLGDSGGTQGDT